MIIKVNTIDRTNQITWKTFKITDNVNEKINNCSFTVTCYGAKNWKPKVNDEIIVTNLGVRIFAGTIIDISRSMSSSRVENYQVKAVDWTKQLDRNLVIQRYNNKTVNAIITDIRNKYAVGFTVTNVDCPMVISSITFNYATVSEAIQRLAEACNYFWYVDYNKNIHFFDKNKKPAPFNLTDINNTYVFNSLSLKDDLSQIRNKVRIRGGEVEGDPRIETHDGDGVKKIFALANKFASLPVVKVNGVVQNVGVEFLGEETAFDVFWNFNEKYIRFRDTKEPPVGANNIEVSGVPLIPIIVELVDYASVSSFGVYEFYKKDVSIRSVEEARRFALAELEAYSTSIIEGGFDTIKTGLKSGQIINIQSDIRGINESFIIQSVKLRMRSSDSFIYTITLATLRTLGIIKLLQTMLLGDKLKIEDIENEVLYRFYIDHQFFGVTELIRKDPFVIFPVLAPHFPVNDADNRRHYVLDVLAPLF